MPRVIGVLLFKTEMQYDFVVAPGAPVTSTYVYDDSEDVIRFESTNGAPIHVRFNRGELTLDAAVGKINDYDKLIVKNGSGVNLDVDHWVDNAAGNVDISDLTFVSNDGVLEYYIQNNANSSTSNLNPINVQPLYYLMVVLLQMLSLQSILKRKILPVVMSSFLLRLK